MAGKRVKLCVLALTVAISLAMLLFIVLIPGTYAQEPCASLDIHIKNKTMVPTGKKLVTLNITSNEQWGDTFTVYVEIPNKWNISYTNTTNISAYGSASIPMTITAPPLAEPGNYTFNITVHSLSSSYTDARGSFVLEVIRSPMLVVNPQDDSLSIDPGRSGITQVEVKNWGNERADVEMEIAYLRDHSIRERELPDQWKYNYSPQYFSLNPGDSRDVILNITLPYNTPIVWYDVVVKASWGVNYSDAIIHVYVNRIPYLRVKEIWVEPKKPLSNSPVEIYAMIENIGQIRAENVTVRFFIGEYGEKEIGNTTVSVDEGKSATVHITYNFVTPGSYRVVVAVYPNESAPPLTDFMLEKSIKVAMNPDWAIFFGFIGLLIALGIIAIIVFINYIKYPSHEFIGGGEMPRAEEEKVEPSERKEPAPMKLDEEKPSEVVEEPKEGLASEDAERAIEDAAGAIARAREMGIDVLKIQRMLQNAREDFATGNYDRAYQNARWVYDRINATIEKHMKAVEAIRRAKMAISALKWEDVDLSAAKSLVTRAENALRTGNYTAAVMYATKAHEKISDIKK